MSTSETTHDSGALRLVKLQRDSGIRKLGRPQIVVLPNSTRSTVGEAERLRDEEFARTGIEWTVVDV